MSYDALNADQRAGTSLNGKPSYTIDQAAAQLTRSGLSWSSTLGAPTTVTYAYRASAPTTMPSDTSGFGQFTSTQIVATEKALRLWSEMANITFIRVGAGTTGSNAYSNDATILFGDYSSGEAGAAAFAFQPGSRASSSSSGDVWVNISLSSNQSLNNLFNPGFSTLLHEIGHAIGLSHPSDYNASSDVTSTYSANALYAEDSREYSLMSYFPITDTGGSSSSSGSSFIYPGGPLVDDIAAVQRLYGKNYNTAAGDTIYGNSSLPGGRPEDYLQGGGSLQGTIWDGGGNDTIDLSYQFLSQKVDLHAGAFSNLFGGIGNLSIAQGVTIENAYGGGGDDVLIGNDVANYLKGNAGDDTLTGYSGDDVLDGGAGSDTAIFAALFQQATISRSAPTNLTVRGPDGNDRLISIETLKFADGKVQLDDGKPLVDDLFYDQRNVDVYRAGVDPDDHYASVGWREGRDPNFLFSTTGYLAANPDVRSATVDPLQHYDSSGWREGRDPAAAFDTTLYLLHNPDVKRAGIDPLLHFLQYGQYEGRATYGAIGPRIASNGFDAEFYLLANPDVAAAASRSGGDTYAFAVQHYQSTGWKEGRNPNSWFDDRGYLSAYTDVAQAKMNPLDHYDRFGWKEGRDPSVQFDTSAYLSAYRDVAQANIDPLVHFLQFGAYELRNTFGDGSFLT